jgi:AbrB family looped-hinge helix DNA binding protein
MESKTVVSSQGQVVIPKFIREAIGLHSGSELALSVREDHVLELTPIHRDIREFFGKGSARTQDKKMSIGEVDDAIAKVVTEKNSKTKNLSS